MRVVKPSWVMHQDDKERPGTIFSLSVHPDGSRLATAGLDTKIKVWSTLAIMDEKVEQDAKVPKLLSTLTTHSGVVMCVRWSHGGRYLASGSDDNIVIVWNLDGSAGGKVWGTTETNVENWKAVRRLVGHDSDVAGVAWNSDDSYLASVGLDSTVMVWSGRSFELVRRLDGHQGFVKGVVWDPVGQYLATQSDDMTVKIWRTEDWGLEETITAPFKNAPSATFTRLTWSPEGTHVVTPNSMNGPVFVAAVIERLKWTSTNSMVGHQNVIEVAAFNPLIFLRDPNASAEGANLCTLLALSGRNSISLWVTSQSKPLVVLEDVFDRDVLDMSWSADGLSLWSCSSEGHVAVFKFDSPEFNTVAPPGTKEAFHATYDFKRRVPLQLSTAFSTANAGPVVGTMAKPNVLVSRKGPGAKRAVLVPRPPPAAVPLMEQRMGGSAAMPFAAPLPVPSLQSSAFAQASMNAFQASPLENRLFSPQAQVGSSNAAWGGVVDSKKRKVDVAMSPGSYAAGPQARRSESPYRGVGHALGDDRARELPEKEQNEVRPTYVAQPRAERFKITNKEVEDAGEGVRCLAVPSVLSYSSCNLEDGEGADLLEWRNFDEGPRKGLSEIAVISGPTDKTLWLDYLPKFVVCGAGSPQFVAVSTEEGCLNVYSPAGRRLLPTLVLDSPCSLLEAEGHFLMAITALGTISVWNTLLKKSLFSPLNVSTLLLASSNLLAPNPSITTSAVLPNGAPLIALSSGSTHTYDPDLCAWIKLSQPFWAKSDVWEGRRGKAGSAARGVVRGIESAINDILVEGSQDPTVAGVDKPSTSAPEGLTAEKLGDEVLFRTAVSLGHLEAKMVAAIALESAVEYRAFLAVYAKRLADEGIRNKAEELVRDLMGPVYYSPGKSESWSPKVAGLGLNKRELLREILPLFVKSKLLSKFGTDHLELLRKLTG